MYVCIIVGLFCVNPNSLNSLEIHIASLVGWEAYYVNSR
jgi:hypothetical protein